MAEKKANLNTASRDEPARIVGIADECAERIIRCREQRGRIRDVEERSEASGRRDRDGGAPLRRPH